MPVSSSLRGVAFACQSLLSEPRLTASKQKRVFPIAVSSKF